MEQDRTFNKAKRYAGLFGIAGASVLIAGLSVRSLIADPVATAANTRVFVDVQTGRCFRHTIQIGDAEPIESPFTGRRSAYAAEPCYWKKEPGGTWKAKKEPTWVALKERMGQKGQTLCPDCGREVVGHNPMPPPDLMGKAE